VRQQPTIHWSVQTQHSCTPDPGEYVATACPNLGQHPASIQAASDPKKYQLGLAVGNRPSPTSSEYNKKSPFQPQREVAVNAWTTACPEGITLTLDLSVCTIHDGFSPVKNTPDSVTSGVGDVVNGMNWREMRRCSASAEVSCSSGCWSSYAIETVLTNLTASVLARDGGIGSELGSAGRA